MQTRQELQATIEQLKNGRYGIELAINAIHCTEVSEWPSLYGLKLNDRMLAKRKIWDDYRAKIREVNRELEIANDKALRTFASTVVNLFSKQRSWKVVARRIEIAGLEYGCVWRVAEEIAENKKDEAARIRDQELEKLGVHWNSNPSSESTSMILELMLAGIDNEISRAVQELVKEEQHGDQRTG